MEKRSDLIAGLEHHNALLLFGGSHVTKFGGLKHQLTGGMKVWC